MRNGWSWRHAQTDAFVVLLGASVRVAPPSATCRRNLSSDRGRDIN
jgi:hypothetical protein